MKFVYDDGGRAAAGYIGDTRDCVCRAIAIAAQRPYKEVYDLINKYAKSERITKRNPKRSNARTGCRKETAQKILEHYGFTWVATMHIGQGCAAGAIFGASYEYTRKYREFKENERRKEHIGGQQSIFDYIHGGDEQ